MILEIKIGDRTADVELISKEGNKVQVSIDNKMYEVDIVMVENGVYSIILENKSYNIELVRDETGKNIWSIRHIIIFLWRSSTCRQNT